ncbi:MAG: hypothetical protein J2P19_05295 [Pseudonocardia sp.]|nr:hypothetical protein [Pseudonocardia sp.]
MRDAVPRVRALVIVMACAVGAVLGMGTFALAQVASGCGGSSGSGLMGAIVRTAAPVGSHRAGAGCEERLGAAVAPDAAVPGGTARRLPASTATRHVSAPGERIGRRGANPATDRAMALLIGWGTLVLIFGGLLCGRRRREAGGGAEGPHEVRVRVSGSRSGAPRHLLARPPDRAGRSDRPGLPRAIACVIASWRGSAARKADRRNGAAGRRSAGASAVVGSGVAADATVAGRPAGRAAGRATRVGDTVVMRRIVLGGSPTPAGINGRRR